MFKLFEIMKIRSFVFVKIILRCFTHDEHADITC